MCCEVVGFVDGEKVKEKLDILLMLVEVYICYSIVRRRGNDFFYGLVVRFSLGELIFLDFSVFMEKMKVRFF